MNKETQLVIASIIIAVSVIGAALLVKGNYSPGQKIPTKTFNIVMENNRYVPNVIEASVGDRVVINFENRDPVAHGVGISQFNATVPGGHVLPNSRARMEFVADRPLNTDAAVCGGLNPEDKTDDHGEELIVNIT
jgi:plastocyanin